MNEHEKINYVEFPSSDLIATKKFFTTVFSWEFEDFGPEYSAIHNAGLSGGFFKSKMKSSAENGSVLIVLYSNALEKTKEKIEKNGGMVIKPIFNFPGGQRFYFSDPTGNEFAVWSDINA